MKTVLFNARLFVGAADLTSSSNRIELSSSIEEKEVTTFRPEGDVWREVIGGIASTTITGAGYWEAGDPGLVDDAAWAALNGRGRLPATICPATASGGALAYITRGLVTSYTIGDAVGEVAPWELQASGSDVLTRGIVVHPPGVPRTADGAGDGYHIGPVTSGRRLIAALHVLSVAGTNAELEVRIESSSDSGWSNPATQGLFAGTTAPSSQVIAVPGPVADEYWRVAWSVSGDDPSFLFLVSIGIA